jgi:hypothetical protein
MENWRSSGNLPKLDGNSKTRAENCTKLNYTSEESKAVAIVFNKKVS